MLRLGFVKDDWDTFGAGTQIICGRATCPLPDTDWVVARVNNPGCLRVVSEAQLYTLLYGQVPTSDADLITLNQARTIEVPLNYRVPTYSRYLYAAIFRDVIEIVAGISEDSIIGTCLPLVVLKASMVFTGKTRVQILRFPNGEMVSDGVSLFDGNACDLICKLPDRFWAETEQNAP